MSTYTPPLPGHGPLSFLGPYTPPLAGHGPLSFGAESANQTVNVIGINDGAFGVPGVTGPKTVTVPSIGDTSAYGTPSLRYGQFFAYPSGFNSQAFGNAFLQLGNRYLGATGFTAAAYGQPYVDFFLRTLSPTGIKVDAYGAPSMSGGVRYVDLTSRGFDSSAFGNATVTLGIREVFPQWFVATYYGTPMMGYHRTITGAGFDATQWGDVLVWDNTQRPAPQGFDASAFGGTTIDRYTRLLLVKPFAEGDLENIGFPHLHNLRQYITANYVAAQWIEGGIGDYQSMFIRNQNRVVDMVNNGIAPPFRQIPLTHSIANKARLVRPPGLDATVWGPQSFIAHGIRYVFPQGFQPAELSSRFHIVRNAAAQLKPVGFDSARVGTPPLVQNTRRWFYIGGLGDTAAYGRPFVAPRVRTVGPQNVLEPARGLIGGATVWFRQRTITPTPPPFGWGAFGVHVLDVRFNMVAAKSIPPSWAWGQASVTNKTPELRPYWDASLFTLWGNAAIFNRYNPYAIEGWSALLFGDNTIIGYRTKKITPAGFDGARYNPKHSVRNVNPDPPGQQYVVDATLGFTEQLGAVKFLNQALFPQGIMDGLFGTSNVQGMSIFPKGIPPFISDNGTQFGIPSVPGRQYSTVDGIAPGDFGKPVFSPLTVWAPQGAPQQAIDNHGGVIGEAIDAYLDRDNPTRPLFGFPRVELKNRRMQHFNLGPEDSYGLPFLTRKPQYVQPAGARFTKYGFPVLFGGDRSMQAAGFDLARYGTTTVAAIEPHNRPVFPPGMSPLAFGATWVSNFIRELPPAGLDATVWGSTIVQRPPPPAEPLGLDATLWGMPMVAYRIRHLLLEGFDSFVCDYDLGSFRDRMRVRGRNRPSVVSMGDQSAFGVPSLNPQLRGIAALGLWPPSPEVPRPTVRRQNRVQVVSVGQQDAWGEPWALPVLPGTIQPRGDDFGAFGGMQLNRQVLLDGWGGAIGTPRLGAPVGAAGFDPSQFGSTVVMGFGCGRQARVMGGWDSATVGAASVNRGT